MVPKMMLVMGALGISKLLVIEYGCTLTDFDRGDNRDKLICGI
jgi:hypothetical protein